MRASGRYKWTVNGDILELVASFILNQGVGVVEKRIGTCIGYLV